MEIVLPRIVGGRLLKRFFLSLLIFGSPAICFSSYHFRDQEIPNTAVLEETGDVLDCRGIALEKHFFQDNYIAAFYSQRHVKNPLEALTDTGPRRMLIVVLRSVDNFKEMLETAITENNSPDVIERDQISISQFLKSIDYPLRKGDILVLDYVPNVGTKVTVKGSLRAIIKGAEFYNLILKIWMGREPPSKKFRNDLFNLT